MKVRSLLFAACLLACSPPAAAQDCTLSATAECNDVPCAGETRPEGRIVYNSDYDVAQICRDGTWRALYPFNSVPCPGSGLVGHWKLDDGTGSTTAADSSGSGNTGTLTNMDANTDWVAGQIGDALDFDGGNDYVDVGAGASLQITGAKTIAAWVKLNSYRASLNYRGYAGAVR